jgi:translation initiation factor 6
MIAFADFGGSNFLGIFAAASDKLVIIPPPTNEQTLQKVQQFLQVEPLRTTLGGTNLIGSLAVINSNGAVISGFATASELERMNERVPTALLKDKFNAAGNNIVANDRGAIVNPDIGSKAIRQIADVLGVNVERGTIAGLRTVGSACAANNSGALCHPEVTEQELRLVEDVLKVNAKIGTANYGTPLVGACLLSNSKGILTGSTTTPIEIGRIEDALSI